MSAAPLSKFALKILRKTVAAGGAAMAEGGGLKAGSLAAPASVAEILAARDLIAADAAARRYRPTAHGRAYLARLETPPKPAAGEAVAGYRAQHLALARTPREDADGVRRPLIVNQGESPLGWLARRKGRDGKPLLSAEQVEAGERLRADFERGGLGAKVTRDYAAPPIARHRRGPEGGADITAAQIDARRRVDGALAAAGPGLADVLVRVCCHLEGLEQAEKALGWPQRAGKLVLAIALDRLAAHYRGERRDRGGPDMRRAASGAGAS